MEREHLDAALEIARREMRLGREPLQRSLAWRLKRRFGLAQGEADRVAAEALRLRREELGRQV